MTPTRALAVIAVLAVGLSACGVAPEGAAEPSGGSTTTVEHRFGTTEITGVPDRIVTLDLQWTDSLLVMGGDPVGFAVDSLMPGDGSAPWWDEGAMSGTPLRMSDGLPLERIAALKPDLILGLYSISDKKAYNRLASIAPTLPGSSADLVPPWSELVGTLGKVLHKRDRAKHVVDSVNGKLEQVASDLPGLSGKTFALAKYVVDKATLGVVADAHDGSSVFFRRLGMKLLPAVAKQGERSGDARVFVSTERVDLLRADLLALWVSSGDETDLQDIPGWSRLPAVETDAAATLDYAEIVALNTPTPLSWPYVLDALRPRLEAAAKA